MENRQRYTRQKILRRRTDDSDCKVQALWDTLLITFTSIFLSMTEDEESFSDGGSAECGGGSLSQWSEEFREPSTAPTPTASAGAGPAVCGVAHRQRGLTVWDISSGAMRFDIPRELNGVERRVS